MSHSSLRNIEGVLIIHLDQDLRLSCDGRLQQNDHPLRTVNKPYPSGLIDRAVVVVGGLVQAAVWSGKKK